MKLSSAEFWELSPREFFRLLDLYHDEQEMLNYRAGLGPAIARNLKRQRETDKVWQPMDFFTPPKKEGEVEILSAEEILDKMQILDTLKGQN